MASDSHTGMHEDGRSSVEVCMANALHMIGTRNPTDADAVVESMSSHEEPVEECLGEFRRQQTGLTAKGSGGDQLARLSRWMSDKKANLESGDTVGNVGLLPFLIRTSGRGPCCQAAQLLDGRNLRQHGTQERPWHIATAM